MAGELAPIVQIVLTAWLFALGCAVGSFLNVVIYRLPRGLTILEPRRSFCPRCGHAIRWHDNVPLLSFLFLGRRCRDCAGPISWRYPAVEGLTGLLFALIFYRQAVASGTDVGQTVIMILAASLLLVAAAVDVEWFIIPDEISLFGLLGGLLAGLLIPSLHVGAASYHTWEKLTGLAHLDGLIASAVGAVSGGLLLWMVRVVGRLLFRREAMGLGDAKLMAMIGAFFGWKVVLVTFFLSPFLGVLYGVPRLVLKGEHLMPYGPFLSLGAVLALLFRTELCSFLEPLEYLVGLLA